VSEKVEAQRAIKKLESRRDELMLAKFERKKAIRREVEDILDSVQASLKLSPRSISCSPCGGSCSGEAMRPYRLRRRWCRYLRPR